MNTVTTQNNIPLRIAGIMQVAIYPHPVMPMPAPLILDLARKDTLIVIATGEESVVDTDAAVTTNKDITLAIRTRDCAPICFSDGKKIGIAHVGWQGYALGLTEKTLGYFDLENLVVYVGPFLNSFEIKKDFCYDALMAKPETVSYIDEVGGTLTFRFKDALASILPENTFFDTRTTWTDPTLPSHRREKESIGFLTTVSFI